MSAVRLKLLPMLAFTKQHKTYMQTIPPQNVRVGHFIFIAPAHALSDGHWTRKRGRGRTP